MPTTSDRLQPSRLAPLFVLIALIHAAAIVTRFDLVRAMLPELVHAAVLCAALPLLLITGYFESRLDHGKAMPRVKVKNHWARWAVGHASGGVGSMGPKDQSRVWRATTAR